MSLKMYDKDNQIEKSIGKHRTKQRITGTLQREKSAILFLRKKFGYSINNLAQAFGRSTSLIQRVLKFNRLIGNLKFQNCQTLPDRVKKIGSAAQKRKLNAFMGLWEAFILGEVDRPP